MIELSPSQVTLFADLAQRLGTAVPAGSPHLKIRDGIEYWYAKMPVGATRVDRFLGRGDDPNVQEQVTSLKNGSLLARGRRKTVSMIRNSGVAGPDRRLGAVLDVLSQAGLFKAGAVLVGTAAYLTYEPLVGAKLPAPTLMTGDADLATARLDLRSEPPEDMLGILRRADPSFEAVLQLDPRKPSSRFRTTDGYLVDLIAPVRHKTDSNPVPLKSLSAGAAPLQHIAWLLSEPVPHVALWGTGIPIVVPQPARYAVHKLIVAQKRRDGERAKRTKDLAQAKGMFAALERQDPFALEDALDDARTQGKGWSDSIDRSLAELATAHG